MSVNPSTYTLGRFKVKVISYIAIITAILFLEAYLITSQQPFFSISLVAVILCYFIYRLFSLVNRTNRDLTNFLLSIRFDDFETTYTQSEKQSDDKQSLYNAFNLITGKFRDIRMEKEAQHQFLIALVEQIDTGIICFDEEGRTVLMNHALQKLLHKSYLPSVDSLKKIDDRLYESIVDYKPGERKLMKLEIDHKQLQLSFFGTILKMNNQSLSLFSFKDIRTELEFREMESWQKLIRILTHEIMNSVSPVVSLATTTDHIVANAEGMEESTRTDLHQAIRAIQKRGASLLEFTHRYRKLTRLPPPDFETVDFKELIEQLLILHKPELEEKEINLITQLPKHKVLLEGDGSLLEQAFINLIKNAIQALDGHKDPVLEIRMYKEGSMTIVQIADTGDGIEEDMLEQIFIPFFTTRKNGSGIGLSLCRQIIIAHQGSIDVQSELGKGTVFTAKLP